MPRPACRHRRRVPGRTTRSRLLVEPLEDRLLLSPFVVTNTCDSGPGSLRAAITGSNSDPGLNTISFHIGNGGAETISPLSPLPAITNRVIIDGTTQKGYSGTALILISAVKYGVSGSGLVLGSAAATSSTPATSSSGSTIKGLGIEAFIDDGILITTDKNLVQDTQISDNVGDGVQITNGAGDNTLTDNTISNDFGNGVEVDGTAYTTIGESGSGNLITGNSDGILLLSAASSVVDGNTILANDSNGIEDNGGGANTIGETTWGLGNTIQANGGDGLLLLKTALNVVEGNSISSNDGNGLEVNGSPMSSISGTASVSVINTIMGNDIRANLTDGISLIGGANKNLVEANDIESNLLNGVDLTGVLTTENTIGGNATGGGNTISGNQGDGIDVVASEANWIGGTEAGAGNVISGNIGNGISLTSLATGNQVLGNFIGTDPSGMSVLPNGLDGLDLDGAPGNSIGGTATGARNVISGNGNDGIELGSNSNGNQVLGNYIGTDATGSRALRNGSAGLYLAEVDGNAIGGTATADRNFISGNGTSGIELASAATGNQVLGNFIGTAASGEAALPNGRDGVELAGATGNAIGGTANGARNVISGNIGSGISLTAGATGNQVLGNFIGTDALGASPIRDQYETDGVYLAGVTGNPIGGTATGAGNVISGNTGSGINLASAANGNQVQGNFIGTDVSGEFPVGNAYGISINAASDNAIGGTVAGSANVISGNTSIGVQISNSAASGNTVQGNRIGTNKEGDQVVLWPNLTTGFPVGVFINDSPGNVIGGTMAGAGNVISGFGVAVDISGYDASGNATEPGNSIFGNSIGTDASGNALNDSVGVGVYINGVGNSTVGASIPNAGNLILGYASYGVFIFGPLATGNEVQGNRIGPSTLRLTPKSIRTRTGPLAAVAIEGASANVVDGNTITGNHDAGIYIYLNSMYNVFVGNNLQKNLYGVLLFNAPNNGSIFSLRNENGFTKNRIANVREFTGVAPVGHFFMGSASNPPLPDARPRARRILKHPSRATHHPMP